MDANDITNQLVCKDFKNGYNFDESEEKDVKLFVRTNPSFTTIIC